jgi:restriction endonuclease Mrr
MPRRQSMTFFKPKRRSRRSSGGSLGFVGVLLGLFILIIAIGSLIRFLQTPTGLVTLVVIIGAIVIAFVITQRQKEKQRQAWIVQQQQQAVRQFNQQQEAARQQQQQAAWRLHQQQEVAKQLHALQELERQEKERQEQERIARMKSLGDILVLTPKEFEELTGKILEANGFHDIQIVGGSGDLGIDIFAWDQFGYKHAVQCKRYAPGNTVGSPAIQTFFGMMFHHQVQKGIFVTTSTFSRPAIDLATQRDIQLIDGNQLIEILERLQQSSQLNSSIIISDKN